MSERARIVREMAYVIKKDFNSNSQQFVFESGYDCTKFVQMVVEKISGFRDEAIFKGQ